MLDHRTTHISTTIHDMMCSKRLEMNSYPPLLNGNYLSLSLLIAISLIGGLTESLAIS